jgi:hypothetical protein
MSPMVNSKGAIPPTPVSHAMEKYNWLEKQIQQSKVQFFE